MKLSNVVCDLDQSDMQAGVVEIGHRILLTRLEGWKCMAPGCTRFYGKQPLGKIGYGDLDDQEDLKNVRPDPACSNGHDEQAMYIQRSDTGLRWVCALCDRSEPFK